MKNNFLLILLFIVAYALRVLFLPQNALTFGYDQARDAYQSIAISKGDLKILGPSASTPGLYHGVFYYYVLAPAYALGKGSPIVAAYWIALLNAATIFIVYYLTTLLKKNKKAALLAAFLFAISFESTQYAVWLSNPTIAIWTVPLAYLGLWMWVKQKRSVGAIIAGLGLGLSVQAEVFLLYHIVPLGIWILLYRKNIKLPEIAKFASAFLIAISTMILVEIKFGFKSLGGLSQLLSSQDPIGYTKSLGDTLTLYLNQLGRVLAYSTYPGNVTYGAMIVLVLLFGALYFWLQKKEAKKDPLHWSTFLALWIFSHSTVVSVGGTSTPFLLVGIAPAVSILLGIVLTTLFEKKYKLVVIGLVVFFIYGNISMILRENPKGQTIFAIQKDMLLSKQLAAIDYTYQNDQNQGGEKFSVNSLTSPLWINIVWTYLYKWYGEPKYGFVPQWRGRDQVGLLDSLPPTEKSVTNYYLILEPMGGIPLRYLDETIGEEDAGSKLLEEKYFGELRIQKRRKL